MSFVLKSSRATDHHHHHHHLFGQSMIVTMNNCKKTVGNSSKLIFYLAFNVH